MLTWLVMGGLLAALVFSLAVVAVPMMLDRQTDVVTAMATSLRATLANPLPLLVWAAVIVTLTLLGFATLLFGLVVIMPILGPALFCRWQQRVASRYWCQGGQPRIE